MSNCCNCTRPIDIGGRDPRNPNLEDLAGYCQKCGGAICEACIANCKTPKGTVCEACQTPNDFQEGG